MRLCNLVLAAAASAVFATSASAAITAQWVQVPIPESIAELDGFQTWDLVVDVTPEDRFLSFRAYSVPESGFTLYNSPQNTAGNASPFAPPSVDFIGFFPSLQFDSYLQTPSLPGSAGAPFGIGSPIIVIGGSTPDGLGDTQSGTESFSSSLISFASGSLTTPEGLDGRIMRMTFSGPAPSFNGRVFSREGP
ncbi:MAG: hypothetical protein ACFCVE_12325, partial [Phycisphaerae bacterium]